MKKISVPLVVMAILTLLFSALPMGAALARSAQNINLNVRNRTGGQVTITLVAANGQSQTLVYPVGQTTTALLEGYYSYYASTSCGNQSGAFNLNVSKLLFFTCGEGVENGVGVNLTKAPSCYSIFDWDTARVWGKIGTHCQSTEAIVGDSIYYYNADWSYSYDYYYMPDGFKCYQAGNGYYYPFCPLE